MNDDPDAMLRQTLVICTLFWLSVLALVFLSACTPAVQVNHEVPQLNGISEAVKKIVVQDCTRPTLAMPPIPQDVVLDIKGDKITANEGGDLLLRYYSQSRQLLKPAVPGTTAP